MPMGNDGHAAPALRSAAPAATPGRHPPGGISRGISPARVSTPARLLALRAGMAVGLRRAEWVFVVLALAAVGEAMNPLVKPFVPARTLDAGSLRQYLMPPIYLVSVCALLARPAATLGAAPRSLPTLALAALALVSYFWSAAPDLTLRRSAMLVGMTLFGLYLATRFRRRDFLVLLAWALGFSAVLSLAFVFLLPGRGLASGVHEGDWRGLYGHKSTLGLYMSLATIVFVIVARGSTRFRWAGWVGAALCALLAVRSGSTTALIIITALLALQALLHVLRTRSTRLILLAAATLLAMASAATVLFYESDSVLRALGKGRSVSGRVPLWNFLLHRVREHPWLGYGYSGFWQGWQGPSAGVAGATGGWYPWHAHNGLLELALNLGGVGVALFLLAYARAVRRAVRTLRVSTAEDALWPATMLAFLLLASASESLIMRYTDLFWLLFIVTAFSPVEWRRTPGARAAPRRDWTWPDSAPSAAAPVSPGIGWRMRWRRAPGARRRASRRRGDR